MAARHKRVVSLLDTGMPEDWNDDHQFDPTDEITWELNLFRTDDYSSDTGGAGAITHQIEGAAAVGHTYISISSGGGASDYASLDSAFTQITSPADAPILTFSVDLDTIDTVDIPFEAGLIDYVASPFAANKSGSYFRISAGHLYAVCGDGAAETTEDLGLVSSFGTDFLVLRVSIEASTVRFYVNNLVTQQINISTHRPTTNLTWRISTQQTTAGENIARLDSLGLQILRKTA
jgi:hypothetical protein